MYVISSLYRVSKCKSILKEDFKNNKRGWEEVEKETETAWIENGAYYMKNTTLTRWNFYKMKTALKKDQDFILEAYIQPKNQEGRYGHFGLLWGFDEQHEYLNRFTLSADGKRSVVAHFEKDHRRIVHRFQNRKLPKIDRKQPIRFSIIRMGDYVHFFINKKVVYSAHESLFAKNGNYIGYYIEPGMEISTNYIELKKIIADEMEVTTGMQQLMSEGMKCE